MRSVPFEIIEAALIDGASPLITFLRVVAPMVKSGIATQRNLRIFISLGGFCLCVGNRYSRHNPTNERWFI